LDPGKILLDLSISVAVGGDCLADISVLRSEPTVSRLVDALAAHPDGGVGSDQARQSNCSASGCGRWPGRTPPISG
jgi:hypothetical protein